MIYLPYNLAVITAQNCVAVRRCTAMEWTDGNATQHAELDLCGMLHLHTTRQCVCMNAAVEHNVLYPRLQRLRTAPNCALTATSSYVNTARRRTQCEWGFIVDLAHGH